MPGQNLHNRYEILRDFCAPALDLMIIFLILILSCLVNDHVMSCYVFLKITKINFKNY